jgi:hypothetical protein
MKIQSVWVTLLLALALNGTAVAQQKGPATQELAGTWQGKLQADPKTALTIQFTFAKKPDGTYSAVLNSPDNAAIKDMAADSVTWKGGTVSLKVAALSGAFDGTLTGGSITGQWKQPGATLPLVLSPYQKPVLSKAVVATLAGSWTGPLSAPGGQTLTFVAQFKVDDKGELQGSLFVPEQGITLPMSDIQFADNKLVFKIAPVFGEFTGTYANGTFTGLWRQNNNPPAGMPVVLKKGEYVAKVVVLKMPSDAFGQVVGTWKGTLQAPGPQGPVTVPLVLRFETNQRADMVGYLDLPAQKMLALPMTEASVTAGKLVVKIGSIGGEYDATLSGNTLSGQWKVGPQAVPLTLTRN